MLPQHAPHQLIQHHHIEEERPPSHRWHQYRGVHEALFDPPKCLLTIVIPGNDLILAQKLEERLAGGREL